MSSHLTAASVRAVRLTGPEADRVERLMIEWFSSPFWLSDASIVTWFDHGRDPMRVVPQVVTRVAEGELASYIREFALPTAVPESSLALVDRYVLDPTVQSTMTDVRAMSAACAEDSTTEALIWFDGGFVVSSSVPSLVAMVVAESIESCVRFPVDHGIRRVLGTTRRRTLTMLGRRQPILAREANVIGVGALLPTSTGVAMRSRMVASPGNCVPIALYPLVAALVPEVSGDLVPMIRPRGLIPASTSSVTVWAVSSLRGVVWGFGLAALSPLGRLRRLADRLSASALSLVNPLTRTSIAIRFFRLFGIDSTIPRGLVTRIRLRQGDNPWLTAHERRKARFQVVLDRADLVDEGNRSSGTDDERDLRVVRC